MVRDSHSTSAEVAGGSGKRCLLLFNLCESLICFFCCLGCCLFLFVRPLRLLLVELIGVAFASGCCACFLFGYAICFGAFLCDEKKIISCAKRANSEDKQKTHKRN